MSKLPALMFTALCKHLVAPEQFQSQIGSTSQLKRIGLAKEQLINPVNAVEPAGEKDKEIIIIIIEFALTWLKGVLHPENYFFIVKKSLVPLSNLH